MENLYTTPFLIQTFLIPEINAIAKDSPPESFGTVRQVIFDGKSGYPPLVQTFQIPENIELLKASAPPPPTEFIGTVTQKIFDRKY